MALGFTLALATATCTEATAAFTLADRQTSWMKRVNTPLSEAELAAVRLSAQRGRPLGDPGWVESIASRLNLESTMRPRGRQQIRFPQPPIKEA